MRLTRYLREECVALRLATQPPDDEQIETARENGGKALERLYWRTKEAVLTELAQLLDRSGRVGSVNRLATDLINRERKATTGTRIAPERIQG